MTGASLDPDVQAFVEAARGSLFPRLSGLPAGRLRATINAALLSHDGLDYEPEPVFRVVNDVYSGVPTRVYFPAGQPRAVIVYLHGGGFVAGNVDTHDKTTRNTANDARSIVVSVDYRLAPEHPFPLPFKDAVAATVEASTRYPHLPLIVMGDSAGGALAASVAQWARDTRRVTLRGQVLIYPVVDLDPTTESMRRYGADYLLTRDDLAMYRSYYLADAADVPYALPGRASDLRELAPAVITVAQFDPLRDEGTSYARRLIAAGNRVDFIEREGLIHGWLEFAELVPAAMRARDHLVESVRALIDGGD